jgi:hypothetical protein
MLRSSPRNAFPYAVRIQPVNCQLLSSAEQRIHKVILTSEHGGPAWAVWIIDDDFCAPVPDRRDRGPARVGQGVARQLVQAVVTVGSASTSPSPSRVPSSQGQQQDHPERVVAPRGAAPLLLVPGSGAAAKIRRHSPRPRGGRRTSRRISPPPPLPTVAAGTR